METSPLLLGSKCESVKWAGMSVHGDHQTGASVAKEVEMSLGKITVGQTLTVQDRVGGFYEEIGITLCLRVHVELERRGD